MGGGGCRETNEIVLLARPVKSKKDQTYGHTDPVRTCVDCGDPISVAPTGRPRLRCDPCRTARAKGYYRAHEGQQRAERRERHRAEHPDWAAEVAAGKNLRRRQRRAANPEKIRAAEQLYQVTIEPDALGMTDD